MDQHRVPLDIQRRNNTNTSELFHKIDNAEILPNSF